MILSQKAVEAMQARTARYPIKRSGVLPALTIAYHEVGHLNDEIYIEIAKAIKVPVVEVAEAASFYTMFPKGLLL